MAKDSRSSNLNGTNYKLGADIDLSAHVWEGIGSESYPFAGSIDGMFYSIKNIKTAVDEYLNSSAGLCINVGNPVIQNLILSDCNFKAIYNAGALVVDGTATIRDCIIKDVSIDGASMIGGFAGAFSGTIANSMLMNCTLTGSNAAAFASWTGSLTITDCGAIGVSITSPNSDALLNHNEWGKTISGVYSQCTINGVTSNVMYGDSTAWDNWTYNAGLNGGYPVQKTLFHIGGLSGGENVYNYLKNTLKFTAA